MELSINNVSKSFGKSNVLRRVSFQLKTGELLGLFGRNGSGKSTLLKIIFGTLAADELSIQLNGTILKPSEVIKKQHIAYLPQHSFLPATGKVRDIIPLFFSEEKEQDAIFYDPFIATFTSKQIGELSHGERKYVEVVILGNLPHPFLILDEPFSMLEPIQIERVKAFLLKLTSNKGILLTDHYYNDVLNITSRNLILSEGQLHPVATVEDLKEFTYLRKN